jgi:hypothetical protein
MGKSETSKDYKQLAVEKYLEQVKILTALATTLLLTPNILLTILEKEVVRDRLDLLFQNWRLVLVLTNISFLLVILMTYFIYSSVVGSLYYNSLDIYRKATRVFSLLQFVFMVIGCVGFVIILSLVI